MPNLATCLTICLGTLTESETSLFVIMITIVVFLFVITSISVVSPFSPWFINGLYFLTSIRRVSRQLTWFVVAWWGGIPRPPLQLWGSIRGFWKRQINGNESTVCKCWPQSTLFRQSFLINTQNSPIDHSWSTIMAPPPPNLNPLLLNWSSTWSRALCARQGSYMSLQLESKLKLQLWDNLSNKTLI